MTRLAGLKMIQGWANGIRANSLLINPAYYDDQSGIAGVIGAEPAMSYAAFPGTQFAVLSGNTWVPVSVTLYPSVQSSPTVAGYQGSEASCSNEGTVKSWGKAYNFLQFIGSGVNQCGQ